MKKLFFLLFATILFAQNLQLHYDYKKERKYLTSTIEMFKPDEYGSTFFFVDMDYNNKGDKNISLAYWEIARYITLPVLDNKLSATVQYNDGMTNSFSFDKVWLFGFSYPVDLGFVTLSTDILLRNEHNHDLGFQLTTVWSKPFFDNKLVFTGFVDIWSSKVKDSNKDTKYVFLTEPQIWYNVNNHLAIGGEVEISNNFIFGKKDVQFFPTIALKWNF
jgi:hypothetical protein